ncbi:MAG: hypothetical protein VX438_16175 [Planctomycetota bacterium]|nr:hypothetical protein [Planctomycetota bacterium]
MNRSSGILIFASVYSVCMLVILCLLQIKYDVRKLQNNQLISPKLQCLEQETPSTHYVVMNPIKLHYPVNLDPRDSKPNILIATLPAKQVSGSAKLKHRRVAKSQLQNAEFRNWLSVAWKTLKDFPQAVASVKFPAFSSATHTPRVSKINHLKPTETAKPTIKNASFKKTLVLPGESPEPISPEPHVLVANDFDAIQNLKTNVKWLSNIRVKPKALSKIQQALQELGDQGSLDAGICEAALYRMLTGANSLALAYENAEDSRLLDDVKAQIQSSVNRWIDLLNGVPAATPVPNSLTQ